MTEKHYVYFCDAVRNVEMVYEYHNREAMSNDLDLFNYNCAKCDTNDYTAYEIDEGTAKHLIEQARDKTMYYVNNACAWYVGEFHY